MSTTQSADSKMHRLADFAAAARSRIPLTPEPEPDDLATLSRADTDRAFKMIGEVAALLPAVVSRCAELDAAIASTRQRTQGDLERVADVALQWQRVAQGLKLQTEELARDTAAFRRNAEAAEAEAERLAAAAEQSRRATHHATAVNALFQRKILDSFGTGASARAIMPDTALNPG